jgi:hypothetical protein
VSVDNRYTGVGYEPPIHTEPLDTGRYVLVEDYHELESRVRELEAELAECKGDPDSYDNTYKRNLELQRQLTELRTRHAALVEDILKQVQGMEKMRGSQLDMIQDQLKAALVEVK